LIPALLAAFVGVRAHYQTIARELASDAPLDAGGLKPPVVLLPIGAGALLLARRCASP